MLKAPPSRIKKEDQKRRTDERPLNKDIKIDTKSTTEANRIRSTSTNNPNNVIKTCQITILNWVQVLSCRVLQGEDQKRGSADWKGTGIYFMREEKTCIWSK